MCVGGTHDGGFEQTVVAVNAHERFDDEHEEAEVVLRRFAGAVEQCARVGRKAPVVVLTRTVDASEGLFVEEAAEAVLACNLAHERHDEHVVVYGQVALFENRRKLKLVGSNLVVARLAGDAEFESLDFEVAHEFLYAFGDSSEVVVVHLLVLSRVVAHEGATREQQVGACGV